MPTKKLINGIVNPTPWTLDPLIHQNISCSMIKETLGPFPIDATFPATIHIIVGIKTFNIQQSDLSLYTEFSISVKADNPNHLIGFIYGKESSVASLYTGKTLCSGKFPTFHQPENNITMMNILMKGKNEFGSGLQERLLQNQKKGKIPLLIMVKAFVSVVIAGFPLRQVVVFVNCSLVVDNLSPNHKIGIL
ncbi:Late embryogenesis abundant hydroxyproline-rich glycoprotein family, putative [Theobroma cacao]|uniref:Late embryogenesis abundant hydroxyproline-rich glycoprotein family, putative n=1 Tax=Theobroma cacao TaxID=3641 RepID=A0A061E2W0_THECC|nr:Late embryogenesis abundant hydroxyproline-rich glycoprotein family, putative [Theobroma cacao]